jgi:hypothetical protein
VGKKQVLRLSIKNAFEEVKPRPSHDLLFVVPLDIFGEVLQVRFFKVQA